MVELVYLFITISHNNDSNLTTTTITLLTMEYFSLYVYKSDYLELPVRVAYYVAVTDFHTANPAFIISFSIVNNYVVTGAKYCTPAN